MKELMKIVIVGHVDHGKSTLIGRLFFDTGSLPPEKIDEVRQICESLGKDMEFSYIMDHLEEERKQGITIDTATTFFRTNKKQYMIIDAPGHVEFLKNMITGASQAEAAILIVDVKEGVKEQTRRHAYILGMLGLKQVIVVMNKMDAVEYDQARHDSVKKELLGFLDSISIKPVNIIPISASKGDNVASKSASMPWYAGPTVLDALDCLAPKPSKKESPLRYPVQDVYKVNDKRMIVGRIESGCMNSGQEVIFLPSKRKTSLTSIEVWKSRKQQAFAGESIGITTDDPLFIERGEVMSSIDDQPSVSEDIEASIFMMAKEALKPGDTVAFRCATQEAECSVVRIESKMNSSTLEAIDDKSSIETNEVASVVIRSEKPVVFDRFSKIEELGRFVLEKGMDVIAGGIIR